MGRSLVAILVALGVLGSGAATAAPAGLQLQQVATGLDNVTDIENAGDGSGRLFITTQDGRILIRDSTGLRTTPFLDIRTLVSHAGEQGLLGLAFHPGYATHRFFYVDYTDHAGTVVVARYAPSATDANVADPATATVILTIPHPYAIHNGGQLKFGPDGYLYIASGDGGDRGDPANEGQNLDTLLGKILRVDVDHGLPYTIPTTNPFRLTPNARPEIWAYGLRNPWRFSFDRATGDLLIADVGECEYEEIDFQPANDPGGENYGWRIMEGSKCFDPDTFDTSPTGCDTTGLTLPVMEYWHLGYRCAVTGGYRYRGSATPSLAGTYLFGDVCDGRIWAAQRDAGGSWAFVPVIDSGFYVTTFGEDEAGEIYVADYRPGGSLHRIVAGTPALSMTEEARVTEGDTGTTNAIFKVFLLPASSTTVTVGYSTSDGTAQAWSDYVPKSGMLTFAPGVKSATIAVPVLGDTTYELSNEDFSVSLHNTADAAVFSGGRTGTAFITDDDSGLSINDTVLAEGDAGTTDAVFTVSRLGALDKAVTVDFATTDGTATAGSDYVATAGTLTMPPGVSTATLIVPVLGDILVEPGETFTVALANPLNASIVRGTGTGTIYNDDAGPTISIDDVSVVEGNSGTTDAVFTASLSRTSVQTVTVTYSVGSGTASANDYVGSGGSFTFLPGVTNQTFSVAVVGDTLNEPDETFVVYPTGTNGTPSRYFAVGTIIDDDPEPMVSVADAITTEGDSGTKSLRFTVGLSTISGRSVTIPYATSPATAQEATITTVQNPTKVALDSPDVATPYPSTITVPSFVGTVGKVTVTLPYLSYPTTTQNLRILLVGPHGQSVVLMAGVQALASNGVSLIFDDDGPVIPSSSTDMYSGTYRPTDNDPAGDTGAYAPPAPPGPYGASLSVFNGVDPVGTWSLYIVGTQWLPAPVGLWGWSINIRSEGDYLRTVGTLTIPPGSLSWAVDVPLIGDLTVEPDETFNLDLSTPTYATIASGHATGTILNDDQPTLTVSDVAVNRSSTNVVDAAFTVSVDQPGLLPVTADYATADGTAIAGSDYTPVAGSLTFQPAGATSFTVTVPVAPGTAPGLDKTFFLQVANAANATVAKGEGLGTIVLPPPAVSVADVSVREGSLGPAPASFPVTLSGPSSRVVELSYATADGTATGANHDYLPTTGTLTFAPGTTSLPIAVAVVGDLVHEPDETFSVSISTAAPILRGQAVGTILNDDAVEQIYFGTPNYTIGEAAGSATITVRRSGGTEGGVTVDYFTSDGTATASQDYTTASGTLTFAANHTGATFSVPVTKDAAHEDAETILLHLANPQHATHDAGIGFPGTAVLTLKDDDTAGRIRFSAPAHGVTESGGSVRLIVWRTGGLASDVTVHYATSPGTATGGGTDYDDASGDLTFGRTGPGASSQTIVIPVRDDALPEGAETFTVTLSAPGGGAVLTSPWVAAVTIRDGEPTLEFSSATYAAKEGQPSATITVVRSGPLTGAATVGYSTGGVGDTATAGADYEATIGTLTFPAGAALRTFAVPILTDTLAEGAESLTLTLSGPSGIALGSRSTAVLTLQDDDTMPALQFSAATYVVNEATPVAIVTVKRSGGMADEVTVDYASVSWQWGSAMNGPDQYGDYEMPPGTLTFGKGVFVRTVSVPIFNDALDEGTETAILALSNPRNVTHPGQVALGAVDTAVLSIRDDEPTVQFSAAAYSVNEAATRFMVPVKRTGSLTDEATVHYLAFGGSAVPDTGGGGDYVALPQGTLTFAPGQTLKTFAITLEPDNRADGARTIELALWQPSGSVRLGTPSTTVVTIKDDDTAGRASFSADSYSAAESAGLATITVTRSGGSASEATVRYAIASGASGSPAGPGDFDPASGTLTFGSNERSKTFPVFLHDDGVPSSGAVSVDLTLDSPGGGLALGAIPVATLWIVRE